MKNYLISGLLNKYRIKLKIFALSPNDAIKTFKNIYPESEDIYIVQDIFRKS